MTERAAWLDRVLFPALAVLMLFANGRWAVALITWIAPALLVRYLRTRPRGRAVLGGWLALSVANYVWWLGVFPLRGVAYAIASAVLGLVTLLPFLLDRALARRVGGVWGTLVLPSAMVSLELLQSATSPYGSWGSLAYSQAAFLPLLQVVSVTGLAGVTFLLLWFAALANFWWETRRGIRGSVIAYAATLGAVLVFGALRLAGPMGGDDVRVAAITPRIPTYTVRGDAANQAIHEALSAVRKGGTLTATRWETFRARAAAIDSELLATTRDEARQGARLVLWSEGAGIVEAQDEPALLAQAAAVARESKVWIELSYLVLHARGNVPFENQNTLVDPTGRAVWTYHKAHPVPGMEACVPGDGRVPSAPTPFGRVATVICYDTDFPRLVRQAGLAGADLLLIPADDWREIAPLHATMARFRAIEQGLSIVRATSNGFSLTVDPLGRIRSMADTRTGPRTLRADVPRAGVRTVYARWGDAAGWAAVGLLAALIVTVPWRRFAMTSTSTDFSSCTTV